MLKVPKVSAPLAKAIRTSEGVLTWLVNAGLWATTIVDPSKLPTKEAAWLSAASVALHSASRTLLKVQALMYGVVGGGAIVPDALPDVPHDPQP